MKLLLLALIAVVNCQYYLAPEAIGTGDGSDASNAAVYGTFKSTLESHHYSQCTCSCLRCYDRDFNMGHCIPGRNVHAGRR